MKKERNRLRVKPVLVIINCHKSAGYMNGWYFLLGMCVRACVRVCVNYLLMRKARLTNRALINPAMYQSES